MPFFNIREDPGSDILQSPFYRDWVTSAEAGGPGSSPVAAVPVTSQRVNIYHQETPEGSSIWVTSCPS